MEVIDGFSEEDLWLANEPRISLELQLARR